MDETKEPGRVGRRALLAGAAAGAVAAVGGAILGPDAVEAGGSTLVLGEINESNAPTRIYSPAFGSYDQNVFLSHSSGSVVGASQKTGGVGVAGYASGQNGIAISAQTDGHSSTTGLKAISDPEGYAIDAYTVNGAGIRTTATGGYAIEIHGRAVFSRSGKVTFSAGQLSKSVTRAGGQNYIGPDTIIVATIQGFADGTWVAGVIRNGDQKFTIRLNRAAPKELVVGWVAIN